MSPRYNSLPYANDDQTGITNYGSIDPNGGSPGQASGPDYD